MLWSKGQQRAMIRRADANTMQRAHRCLNRDNRMPKKGERPRESKGEHMTITTSHTGTTQGFVPVTSYEHFWLHHRPIFIEQQGSTIPVPAFIELPLNGQERQLFLVGIDPGNSAAKYAMYSPQGHLVTRSVPAVLTQAKALATGDQLTTYQQIRPTPREESRATQGQEDGWNE